MLAFCPAVCGVEVDELAAFDCNLGCAICAVLVIAVQYEPVCLYGIGIFLLNLECAAVHFQFAFINIYCVDVADKVTAVDNHLAAVAYVSCKAVVCLGLYLAVAVDDKSAGLGRE